MNKSIVDRGIRNSNCIGVRGVMMVGLDSNYNLCPVTTRGEYPESDPRCTTYQAMIANRTNTNDGKRNNELITCKYVIEYKWEYDNGVDTDKTKRDRRQIVEKRKNPLHDWFTVYTVIDPEKGLVHDNLIIIERNKGSFFSTICHKYEWMHEYFRIHRKGGYPIPTDPKNDLKALHRTSKLLSLKKNFGVVLGADFDKYLRAPSSSINIGKKVDKNTLTYSMWKKSYIPMEGLGIDSFVEKEMLFGSGGNGTCTLIGIYTPMDIQEEIEVPNFPYYVRLQLGATPNNCRIDVWQNVVNIPDVKTPLAAEQEENTTQVTLTESLQTEVQEEASPEEIVEEALPEEVIMVEEIQEGNIQNEEISSEEADENQEIVTESLQAEVQEVEIAKDETAPISSTSDTECECEKSQSVTCQKGMCASGSSFESVLAKVGL